MVVRSLRETKLAEDRAHVRLDRLRAEKELGADARVRSSLGHQFQHLALAWTEVVDRIVLPPLADELRDDLCIHRGPAARNALHRLDEVVDLEHAVLEQIAEALRTFTEQTQRG